MSESLAHEGPACDTSPPPLPAPLMRSHQKFFNEIDNPIAYLLLNFTYISRTLKIFFYSRTAAKRAGFLAGYPVILK